MNIIQTTDKLYGLTEGVFYDCIHTFFNFIQIIII